MPIRPDADNRANWSPVPWSGANSVEIGSNSPERVVPARSGSNDEPMRVPLVVGVIAALALTGCAAEVVPVAAGPATILVGGHQVDVDLAAKADAFFAADPTGEFRNRRAVLVTVGGQAVYERREGPTTPTSTYNVQGVGVSILGTLVGIAVAERRLRLDQTAADLLPEYRDDMSPYLAKLTLGQLLTMSGGLPNAFYPKVLGPAAPPATDWVRTIVAAGQDKLPGRFGHSTGGAHLVAAALRRATGRPVLDYAREKLFDPLGITSTPAAEPVPGAAGSAGYDAADFAWPRDPQGVHLGPGGQKLTASDLARLGRLWLEGGKWEGRQLVPETWLTAATTQQVAAVDGCGYGYGFWTRTVDGRRAFAAMGDGGQLVLVVPDLDLVAVVQSSSPTDPTDPTAAADNGTADALRYADVITELVVPAIGP